LVSLKYIYQWPYKKLWGITFQHTPIFHGNLEFLKDSKAVKYRIFTDASLIHKYVSDIPQNFMAPISFPTDFETKTSPFLNNQFMWYIKQKCPQKHSSLTNKSALPTGECCQTCWLFYWLIPLLHASFLCHEISPQMFWSGLIDWSASHMNKHLRQYIIVNV